MIYDLAIIGGGPAGVGAGVYAARKKLKTVFITDKFSGQSVVSPDIQNWIGEISISGQDLAKKMEDHLKAYANDVINVKEGEKVEKISEENGSFKVKTSSGEYEAKTILVTTGSHRRKLPAKNADILEHKGLTYCATCDGPLFTGKDVVVIGGGNAGFESASQLLAYTKSVTILHRNGDFKADEITVKKISENPKAKLIKNAETTEILGDNFVTGLKYKDIETGEEHELKTDGIFIEIGAVPTTEFVSDLVELTDYNAIKVDPKTQKTSKEGIWAAGDSTDGFYHQNNIAVGDAIKALEDIYLYIKAK